MPKKLSFAQASQYGFIFPGARLWVTPENRAKVVVDEKTGTIVIGRDVRIARVAVAHGNLQVTVQESAQVSKPGPFSNACHGH